MIYVNEPNVGIYYNISHNFKTYRLVRLLNDLNVIDDTELIRHEDEIYKGIPIAVDVDWYHYRVIAGNEVLQF